MELTKKELESRVNVALDMFRRAQQNHYKVDPANNAKDIFRNLITLPKSCLDLVLEAGESKEREVISDFGEDRIRKDLGYAEAYATFLENDFEFARSEIRKPSSVECAFPEIRRMTEKDVKTEGFDSVAQYYVNFAQKKLNNPIEQDRLLLEAKLLGYKIEEIQRDKVPLGNSRFQDIAGNAAVYISVMTDIAREGVNLELPPMRRLKKCVDTVEKYLNLLSESPRFNELELYEKRTGKKGSHFEKLREFSSRYKFYGYESAQKFYVDLAENALRKNIA